MGNKLGTGSGGTCLNIGSGVSTTSIDSSISIPHKTFAFIFSLHLLFPNSQKFCRSGVGVGLGGNYAGGGETTPLLHPKLQSMRYEQSLFITVTFIKQARAKFAKYFEWTPKSKDEETFSADKFPLIIRFKLGFIKRVGSKDKRQKDLVLIDVLFLCWYVPSQPWPVKDQ